MAKINKGSYGYIKQKKKTLLFYLLLIVAIAVGIFVLGLYLNDFSKNNIFTVIAVLLTLPAAKILVSLIVIWPHKSLSREQLEHLEKKIDYKKALLGGMVLTSPQKVMHIKSMAILKDKYVVWTCDKQDKNHIGDYIGKHMYNYGFEKDMVVVDDFNKYIESIDGQAEDTENIDEIVSKLMILEI
ncbi:MAG: undecaprenyl-diphosphate phosphatase [Lachnospiraceae bacterium]|nr:undecaprenyl-diphosphate phosphatase [Lachnospiraceae bacterium]